MIPFRQHSSRRSKFSSSSSSSKPPSRISSNPSVSSKHNSSSSSRSSKPSSSHSSGSSRSSPRSSSRRRSQGKPPSSSRSKIQQQQQQEQTSTPGSSSYSSSNSNKVFLPAHRAQGGVEPRRGGVHKIDVINYLRFLRRVHPITFNLLKQEQLQLAKASFRDFPAKRIYVDLRSLWGFWVKGFPPHISNCQAAERTTCNGSPRPRRSTFRRPGSALRSIVGSAGGEGMKRHGEVGRILR